LNEGSCPWLWLEASRELDLIPGRGSFVRRVGILGETRVRLRGNSSVCGVGFLQAAAPRRNWRCAKVPSGSSRMASLSVLGIDVSLAALARPRRPSASLASTAGLRLSIRGHIWLLSGPRLGRATVILSRRAGTVLALRVMHFVEVHHGGAPWRPRHVRLCAKRFRSRSLAPEYWAAAIAAGAIGECLFKRSDWTTTTLSVSGLGRRWSRSGRGTV
jgi:hypothetical protein